MPLIKIAEEARLHQETYVAILDGLLKYGDHREYAQRAGITPGYLSMIQKLDRDPPAIPSPKTIEKIVSVLPTPLEIRESLQEHMLLAHEKRLRTRKLVEQRILEQDLIDLVQEIGQIHHLGTFATAASSTNRRYYTAQDLIRLTLERASPDEDPLAFVKLCLIAHDVQGHMNRPDQALWNAKRAHFIMTILNPKLYSKTKGESFDYLEVNTIFAEAEAYKRIGLYREADILYEKADQAKILSYAQDFWRPAILVGRITNLANILRFSIAHTEELAGRARKILEKSNEATAPLFTLLTSSALAYAYIRHDNHKDAERELKFVAEMMNTTRFVGTLHKIKFLKGHADLQRAKGDRKGTEFYLREAYQLADDSGAQSEKLELAREIKILEDEGKE